MQKYSWDSNLETGIDLIDNQHKELFRLLDNVTEAIKTNNLDEEVMKSLVFLSDYTNHHFSEEEEIMKKNNYHSLPQHKQIHNELKIYVANMIADIEKNGIDITSIILIQQKISDWLVNHIGKVDKAFSVFLNNKTLTKGE